MPTEEQMNHVVEAIEGLREERSFRRLAGDRVAPAAHGRGTEYGYLFWDELNDAQRRDALDRGIDWAGFDSGERIDVIARVLDGELPDAWMDGITMNEVKEARGEGVDRLVADFRVRVEGLLRDGVPSYPPLGGRKPWAEATAVERLDQIVWESRIGWPIADRPEVIAVPGVVALELVERHVDYAGLPAAQRELLEALRARLDAGAFAGPLPPHENAVADGLARAAGGGDLDEMLATWKEDEERPWSGRPAAEKVRAIVDHSITTAAPGVYTLSVIEREVDYSGLPATQRERLVGLRARIDAGAFDGAGRDPLDRDDRVDRALRLAELEARVEDEKRHGGPNREGVRWPWDELTEEQKLGEIELEIDELHLGAEAGAYEVVAREVDLTGLPEGRRRRFEEGRAGADRIGQRGAGVDAEAARRPDESRAAAMPSREQMERATLEIEALSEDYAFRHVDDRRVALAPHGRGPDDGFSSWGELSDDQKRDALARGVDWGGFTEGEKADVIMRVLDGEPAAAWMDGIKYYNPEEDFARPLTRKQHAAYLADIATGYGMTVEEMDDYYDRLASGGPEGEESVDGDRLMRFRERVEELRRDGTYDRWRHATIPWDEAPASVRLDGLLWAALDPAASGPPLPDAALMAEVDRHVDPDGLAPSQRVRLDDLRAKIAEGRLDGGDTTGHRSAAYDVLRAISGIEHFDRWLEKYKQDGLYNRPANTPWAAVSEADKVHALVGLAKQERAPGDYALAAIEREVDYDRLPPARRAALASLQASIDAGELEGLQPRDLGDRANYALRLTEFEQRVEDYKRNGDPWQLEPAVPWAALPEVRKLDLIVQEAGWQHLHFEPQLYEVIDREVDLSRVPEGRRRGIEESREMTALGHEEYERRRNAPYEPPNEAAAAFKTRIEETLWTTCFTDGKTIFADWSDLTAEAKLYHLAKEMDWDRVPESYFRTMVGRELKVEDLPADRRAALETPKASRHVFAQGFEGEIDAPAQGQAEDRPRYMKTGDGLAWSAEERAAKHRELFDTVNRVQFAETIEKHALDPAIALSSSQRVREVYFQKAESTWDSFREELEFRTDAEVKENLDLFKAKEAQLGDREPKTLMDHLQAGGLFLNAGAPKLSQADAAPPLRDTTRNLIEAIWLDAWPRSGAIVDFGLDSQEHYEAIYYGVRAGEIAPEALDAALGKGEKLTALARSAPSNPHKDIAFSTSWDGLRPEPEFDGGQSGGGNAGSAPAAPARLPSPSEIADRRGSPSPERSRDHDNGKQHGSDKDRDR